MKVFVCFAVLATLALVVSATDFCSKSLCSNQKKHIGCLNNPALGASCPPEAKVIDVTPYIPDILDKHNSHRNAIASGSNKRYSQAARMATMTWDSELAKLAVMNVKTCKYKHDLCHNTDKYMYSGQNLGYVGNSGSYQESKEAILDIIDHWFEEHIDCDMSYIKSYHDTPKSKKKPNGDPIKVGHFTTMVADRNVAVGCGAMAYPRIVNGIIFYSIDLGCNYATGSIKGFPIYEVGQAASKCTTGPNPKYQSLCSVKENYDVNNFF